MKKKWEMTSTENNIYVKEHVTTYGALSTPIKSNTEALMSNEASKFDLSHAYS